MHRVVSGKVIRGTFAPASIFARCKTSSPLECAGQPALCPESTGDSNRCEGLFRLINEVSRALEAALLDKGSWSNPGGRLERSREVKDA